MPCELGDGHQGICSLVLYHEYVHGEVDRLGVAHCKVCYNVNPADCRKLGVGVARADGAAWRVGIELKELPQARPFDAEWGRYLTRGEFVIVNYGDRIHSNYHVFAHCMGAAAAAHTAQGLHLRDVGRVMHKILGGKD
jgi:hypothetical protein